MEADDRSQTIVRTGYVGIGANVLLAMAKAAIGALSNSIAITLDAVNNLSDALSSIITIIGVKLASKPADREHPMGYGRVEYLSTMLIAGIILAAGASSLIESVKALMTPEETAYTSVGLAVIALAVVVKVALGTYTKRVGGRVGSDSLVASGTDALFDAVISVGTLVAAAASLLWGVQIDTLIALVISAVVIKAGVETLMEVLNNILGTRITPKMAHGIKEDIGAVPGVLGVFDLYLDDYGPDRFSGSVHLEVPETYTASQVDELSRRVTSMIYQKYGTVLTCGIYAVPTEEGPVRDLYLSLRKKILAQPGVLQMHGFHLDASCDRVYFDVVRDFSVTDPQSWHAALISAAESVNPRYHYQVTADIDVSD